MMVIKAIAMYVGLGTLYMLLTLGLSMIISFNSQTNKIEVDEFMFMTAFVLGFVIWVFTIMGLMLWMR